MENFLILWQNLPSLINPEIIKIGSFSIRWYSLGYLMGFMTVFLLIYYRYRKKELPKISKFNLSQEQITDHLLNLFIFSALGMLIGARIGYFLIYDWQNLLSNPTSIFLPLENGNFQGFFGMSFHGGLLGAVLSAFLYCKIKKINFQRLSDFFVPAIPLGYFWGRIGNFFNQELYGKITEKPWGMSFNPANSALRHPTQLYEAFLEGLVIFLIFWPLRNKKILKDKFLGLYLILYGIFRFFIEFFRQSPDSQIVLQFLTMGQLLCLAMIFGGIFLICGKRN